ncbi:MAG: ATP-binding cassette domain-containing protein [Bacteroidetes bacterium]|nr:ATP-binding cassette domain-containing protein [Bacteroidota bacterium]
MAESLTQSNLEGSGQQPLSVSDLRGGYNGTPVIDGCNIEIGAGEIVVIMGGSGSGKSTFLRHLIGLKAPMAGRVHLFGESLYDLGEIDRLRLLKRIGVAFQSGALLSALSVGENVALPLVEHTVLDRELIDVIVRMKLDFVGLLGKEDLLPSELSGGMLKRVAVARAIALDPKLIFLDEPSAGLDPAVAAALDTLIIKPRDSLGMSVVVVTHELESAFNIADRIVVLDRGKIIFTGSVAMIKQSPSRRIQNLINRVAEDEEFDPEAHLRRLIGEA